MSNCETCGGTGEIPLLGPNTTSCPDCNGPTWELMAWEVDPSPQNWAFLMFPKASILPSFGACLQDGEVVKLDVLDRKLKVPAQHRKLTRDEFDKAVEYLREQDWLIFDENASRRSNG